MSLLRDASSAPGPGDAGGANEDCATANRWAEDSRSSLGGAYGLSNACQKRQLLAQASVVYAAHPLAQSRRLASSLLDHIESGSRGHGDATPAAAFATA